MKLIKRYFYNFYTFIRYIKSLFLSNEEYWFDPYTVKKISIKGYKSVFCGYYDLNPFCPEFPNLLAIHASKFKPTARPNNKRFLDIIIFDTNSNKFEKVDTTNAWNWQQGARLHWLNSEEIIYNKISNKNAYSVIYNFFTKKKRFLDYPFSCVDKKGNIFSLNYYLLNKCSEYGYSDLIKQDYQIKKISFNKNEIQYSNLIKEKIQFKNTREHINHLLPNPNCTYLVGIERYYKKGSRYDSLIIIPYEGNRKYKLLIDCIVSHYCFVESNKLLIWGNFINQKCGYYLCTISDSFELSKLEFIIDIRDGHPFKYGDDTVITEIGCGRGYTDFGFRLIELNYQKKSIINLIGYVSHPHLIDKSLRCDTHISLNKQNNLIQIDVMPKHNQREIFIIDYSKRD